MALYRLDQLVGKTFFVTKDVVLRRSAFDNGRIFYTAKKGQPIGKLQSWVPPNANRDKYWLEFDDVYGIPFYVPMESNLFSLSKLIEQGAISVKEQIELEKQKEADSKKDGFDKTKEIATIALWGVGLFVGGNILNSIIKNGRN